MRKKLLIYALATVLVVGLLGAGVVMAQDSGNPANTMHQLFLSKLAATLGIDQGKLQEAINEARSQAVDAAVQQGLVPADRAQQLKEGGRMMFGPGGMPKGGPRMMFPPVDIGQILGITREELQAEFKAGKTLAQIAEAKGMTLDQLKEKWLANVKTELDNQVSQGKLTPEQAQNIISKLQNTDLSQHGQGPKKGGARPFRGPRQGAPFNPNK
ncbi:MAG: hypothetical protein ACOY9Y_05560 [Bacillota bacterium]